MTHCLSLASRAVNRMIIKCRDQSSHTFQNESNSPVTFDRLTWVDGERGRSFGRQFIPNLPPFEFPDRRQWWVEEVWEISRVDAPVGQSGLVIQRAATRGVIVQSTVTSSRLVLQSCFCRGGIKTQSGYFYSLEFWYLL